MLKRYNKKLKKTKKTMDNSNIIRKDKKNKNNAYYEKKQDSHQK